MCACLCWKKEISRYGCLIGTYCLVAIDASKHESYQRSDRNNRIVLLENTKAQLVMLIGFLQIVSDRGTNTKRSMVKTYHRKTEVLLQTLSVYAGMLQVM